MFRLTPRRIQSSQGRAFRPTLETLEDRVMLDHKGVPHGKPGGGDGGGGGGEANVAFVFRDVFDGGLFVTDIDDSHRTRLTKPPGGNAADVSGTWSPDLDPATPGYQGQIAFIRRDDGIRDIYVVNPDGSGERLVQTIRYGSDPFFSSGFSSGPHIAWSPNGKKILFTGNGEDAGIPSGLYAVNVAVGGYRFLGSGGEQTINIWAEVSAVRSQIMTSCGDDICSMDFTLDSNGLMVLDSASETRLFTGVEGVGFLNHPTWSPDGRFVAYEYFRPTQESIRVVDLTDESEVLVLESAGGRPAWSPDLDPEAAGYQGQIAFTVARESSKGKQSPTNDIARVIDWQDRPTPQVVLVTETNGAKREVDPAWSPGWIDTSGSSLVAAGLGHGHGKSLTISQVEPLLTEAIAGWRTTGVDISTLKNVEIVIADLSGATLGLASGNTIFIDMNAAGWGWFVDETPWNNSEFTSHGNRGAQNRIDLLSVIAHESWPRPRL